MAYLLSHTFGELQSERWLGTSGQERKIVEGAQHTSCTLEMVNVNEPYDVAVIDEIQVDVFSY